MTNATQQSFRLDQGEFRRLVHVGSQSTPPEDEGDRELCRQLGLFFARNPSVADFARKIVGVTLTPRTSDDPMEPPIVTLVVEHGWKTYRITTDGEGHLPNLPFG